MILLTGGAGLIGSAVLWKLNLMGIDDVIVVDHMGDSDEKWKNLRGAKYLKYVEKDMFFSMGSAEWTSMFSEYGSVDAIIHLGACSSTTCTDMSYLAMNNYECTCRLIDYAHRHDIRTVYASSAATYGDGNMGFVDDASKIGCLRPLNKYGQSKSMADLYAIGKYPSPFFNYNEPISSNGMFDSSGDFEFPLYSLKFSNVFGPGEYHKGCMKSMVMSSFEQIESCGKVKLFRSYRDDYKDGEQRRDFVYVKDVADVVAFMAVGEPKIESGIFNVGSGEATTFNHLVRSSFKAYGVDGDIEYVDMPETLKDKYQYFTMLDVRKMRKAGYVKKFTSVPDAVEDYARYFKKRLRLFDGNLL